MSLFKLFLIFVKIGAILLGGGYVILINYFALAQSLPGIIAANISMFIGYKLKGKWGAVAAMIGVTFVPFWCIVLLASVLGALTNNSYVQGALWGVGISVIALIVLTVKEMWQKSNKNTYFYTIFILTLATLLVFKLSPIQTIVLFTMLGVLYKRLREAKE